MTDFLIMSAAFLILIPSSWPNEISGLVMRMRKVFLIDPPHPLSREQSTETVTYIQNMRRVGKPPYYVWGGQPAGLASPPIRRGYPRAGSDAPCTFRSDDGGPDLPMHQTAVVFHPSSQPEEETTHG